MNTLPIPQVWTPSLLSCASLKIIKRQVEMLSQTYVFSLLCLEECWICSVPLSLSILFHLFSSDVCEPQRRSEGPVLLPWGQTDITDVRRYVRKLQMVSGVISQEREQGMEVRGWQSQTSKRSRPQGRVLMALFLICHFSPNYSHNEHHGVHRRKSE